MLPSENPAVSVPAGAGNAASLSASEPPAEPVTADQLVTAEQLDAIADQGIAAWLSADPSADLSAVTFSIVDLPDLELGRAIGNAIDIDPAAAGHGWSVVVADGAPRMDLLTVVLHELGHVLGYEHTTQGLMAPTLAAGETHVVPPIEAAPETVETPAPVSEDLPVTLSADEPVTPTADDPPSGISPSLIVDPPVLDFSTVEIGSTVVLAVAASNEGAADLEIAAVSVDPADAGFTVTGTPATLAPGQSETLEVAFAPARAGSATATVTLTTGDPTVTASVSLSGLGTEPANPVILSAEALDPCGVLDDGATLDLSGCGSAVWVVVHADSSITYGVGTETGGPITEITTILGEPRSVEVRAGDGADTSSSSAARR